MANRWLSRPSSDSWLGDNRRSGNAIGSNGRAKGSTILVQRPASLAHKSSSLKSSQTAMPSKIGGTISPKERSISLSHQSSSQSIVRKLSPTGPMRSNDPDGFDEDHYCSAQALPYQHHAYGDNDTVPETIPPKQFHINRDVGAFCDSQVSNIENSHNDIELGNGGSTSPNHECSSDRSSQVSSSSLTTTASGLIALSHTGNPRILANITNAPNPTQSTLDIPEWDGCHPDFFMKRMKAIPRHDLESWGKREFYKSYSSWEKMTMDQRNKALSYFRSLPEEVQGMYAFSFIFLFYCSTPAR